MEEENNTTNCSNNSCNKNRSDSDFNPPSSSEIELRKVAEAEQEPPPAASEAQQRRPRRSHPPPPKRFIKNQIPDSILNDAALNDAISLLPPNYSFEVHKCVWRILRDGAKRVALQLPEGLLMYSTILSDILTAFAAADHVFVLGDVTYGACCVDDFSASALSADLLIHFGHSCLVPLDRTSLNVLYIFVSISIDVPRFLETITLNFSSPADIVLAGTIQFSSAIHLARPALEAARFRVLIPQSKPLSPGEVLGCTAPTLRSSSSSFSRDDDDDDDAFLVFVADGRFHLEALMIANPRLKAFRYDPYLGTIFREEYDHEGMRASRRNAILKAREAKHWGILLGTLGRQGNPAVLDRLEEKLRRKDGVSWTVVLMSEITPARLALFNDSVDAWIQIACPRLSIDWGDAFPKPLLTTFEADIALGFLPGWWEGANVSNKSKGCCRKDRVDCGKGQYCSSSSCCRPTDYPMDYYAQDGGEWNSSYSTKSSRPPRRNSTTPSCTTSIAGGCS